MKSITTILLFLPIMLNAQINDVKLYMFGHSLLDHRPPAISTPSNETTVAHWMHLLAQHESKTYQATGQYGFLRNHDDLPPTSQWGYDIVSSPWDSDLGTLFSEVDFTSVIITPGNFVQWQPASAFYYDSMTESPLSATRTIVEWVDQEEPTAVIYIYENWPDMGGFLANGFPPTPQEFTNFNNNTLGEFHDWFLDYQDSLLVSHPGAEVRMIPTGPIIAELVTSTLSSIPVTDLYEDDAPHGRPTIYFLAALINHMAIYGERASYTYSVPSIVHADVATNYQTIVDYIWNYLENFVDTNGDNRVFAASGNSGGGGSTSNPADVKARLDGGTLYINDDQGILLKGRDNNCYLIYVDENGQLQHELKDCPD